MILDSINFLSNILSCLCCLCHMFYFLLWLFHLFHYVCFVINCLWRVFLNWLFADGPLTETLSAPFASSKCTRMLSTATPVLTLKVLFPCWDLFAFATIHIIFGTLIKCVLSWKYMTRFLMCSVWQEFVQCVASKFLIPSFTSKAMCNGYSCCIGCRVFF